MTAGKSQPFKRAADGYPFPIAAACRAYLDRPSDDRWQEWERLSRDVLTPVLHYLSHLLLSDLISTGRKPAHLFHRIQSILSRPLGGHYVGFLRETARYYREEELDSGIPELVDFVLRSDVDCTVLSSSHRFQHLQIHRFELDACRVSVEPVGLVVVEPALLSTDEKAQPIRKVDREPSGAF